ncbi:transposase-like protein [Rhizobium sp. SG570]|nr:transposase-like protein [Rhizobium sp. SG570]
MERDIVVSYETIRRWDKKFGPDYALRLHRKESCRDDIWHLDEGVPRGTHSNVGAELHGR